MSFNSLQYALFLPAVVLLHWLLPKRARNPLLLAASYVFYGAWDYRFLSLLWLTTLVDFFVARAMADAASEARRKRLLLISIAVNLGVLGSFKYAGFFVDSASELLQRAGLAANPRFLEIVLPVGISFYTFQELSYTIDVYRRRMQPCRRLLDFALFVAFFPQLVAGPIERAAHLIPQLQADRRPPGPDRLMSALTLIVLGLFKKVALADPMAPIVEDVFSNAGRAGAARLALGVLAFGIQIYGDFSGYTAIARGSARLLGVELMHNFAQPYLSRNITEFWRRWHISLSRWLRDYLYVPLGGNRRGRILTYRNLMLTMLLGGLWHGAAWTFVVWGGLHGSYLALHRLLGGRRELDDRLPRGAQWLGVIGTFGLVHLAWVFFRAASFSQALDVLGGMISLRPGLGPMSDVALVAAAVLATFALDVAERLPVARWSYLRARPALLGAAQGAMLLGVLVFSGTDFVPFIYFQF